MHPPRPQAKHGRGTSFLAKPGWVERRFAGSSEPGTGRRDSIAEIVRKRAQVESIRQKDGARDGLRRALEVCRQLLAASGSTNPSDSVPEGSPRNLARAEMTVLSQESWGGGSLAAMHRESSLTESEVWLILLLLHERLHSQEGISGRRLLNALFDSSLEVLEGTRLLLRNSRLRSAGLIRPVKESSRRNALDRRFLLSDRVHRLLLEDLSPAQPAVEAPRPKSSPYRNHFELLIDYRRLVRLCRSRARCLFETNSREYRRRRQISAEQWSQRVNQCEQRMTDRLRLTEGVASFPLLKLQQQFRLSPDELLIVSHLLFQEIFEGNSFVEAVDVIKLVCRIESDIFIKHRLLSERGPLFRSELLILDDMVNEKQMTAEVCLNNWVVERLLAPEAKEATFSADARLDFHLFLQRLESSEQFYEELEREG